MASTQEVKAGRAIASFILPPVGIITYFMEREQFPSKAKNYLMISLASLALTITFTLMNRHYNKQVI